MKSDRSPSTQDETRSAWEEFASTVADIRRDQTKAIDAFGKRLVAKKLKEIHSTLESAYAKHGDK